MICLRHLFGSKKVANLTNLFQFFFSHVCIVSWVTIRSGYHVKSTWNERFMYKASSDTKMLYFFINTIFFFRNFLLKDQCIRLSVVKTFKWSSQIKPCYFARARDNLSNHLVNQTEGGTIRAIPPPPRDFDLFSEF